MSETLPSGPRSRWRRVTALVVLASLSFGVAACAGDDAADQAESTDTADATGTTIPPGFPDPPLPPDVMPAEFYLGELAAMGNMKLIVTDFELTADETIAIDLGVENGALQPVLLSPESFLVYATTGQSFAPEPGTADPLFGTPLESAELRRDTMTFPFPDDLTPAALLLDGALYGDRVTSVLIILDERPELDEVPDS